MSASVGAGDGVNLGIIITPMLDMAFQLLAFFVMTYHPHALEGHIDGKLLPPAKAATQGPAIPKSDDMPVVPDDDDTKMNPVVLIKAVPKGQVSNDRKEGEPERLLLKLPDTGDTADTIADAGTNFDKGLKRLKERLDAIQKSPSAGKGISIEADPDLHQQYVVAVYDVCKAAGYRSVGFVPPPLNVHGQ
jgi:biopolymer transport protein ExbD